MLQADGGREQDPPPPLISKSLSGTFSGRTEYRVLAQSYNCIELALYCEEKKQHAEFGAAEGAFAGCSAM